MKTKTEIKLDKEFERLDVKPRIYYYTKDVEPFKAITIAIKSFNSWDSVHTVLANIFTNERLRTRGHSPATRLIQALKSKGIHGIAVCDTRDQFSRRYGRNKARGRLVKHLKEVENDRR